MRTKYEPVKFYTHHRLIIKSTLPWTFYNFGNVSLKTIWLYRVYPLIWIYTAIWSINRLKFANPSLEISNFVSKRSNASKANCGTSNSYLNTLLQFKVSPDQLVNFAVGVDVMRHSKDTNLDQNLQGKLNVKSEMSA